METIAAFVQWIGTTNSELGQQMIAVKRLAVAFAECNIQLIRRDQVARLGILKSRIMEEVENLKGIESAAQMGATGGAFWGGVAAFTIGSLFAAAKGRQDVYNIGLQIASSVLSREVPFGTVLITIDGQGIPNGVKAVSTSRLARESNKTEPEVETSLKHDGFLLMTPEVFAKFLEKVENEILDESVCLPLAGSEVIKQLTR